MSVFVCVSVCMFGVHVGSCSPFCAGFSLNRWSCQDSVSSLQSVWEVLWMHIRVCRCVSCCFPPLHLWYTLPHLHTETHLHWDTFAPTWTVPVSGILLVSGLQSVPLIIKNLNPALNPAVELLELVTDVSPCDPASRCGLVLIQLTCEVYKPWLQCFSWSNYDRLTCDGRFRTWSVCLESVCLSHVHIFF